MKDEDKGASPPRLVTLNVGGHVYETTRSTLERCGYFATLFRNWELQPMCDASGRLFVDRDGDHFGLLLSFCRGSLPRVVLDRLDRTTRLQLMAEASYFDLAALTKALVLPPVGAAVRYAYHRSMSSSQQMRGKSMQLFLCEGTVVDYDHSERTWFINVQRETPIVHSGIMPRVLNPMNEPRSDEFSWRSPPGILDSQRILMPVDNQLTSEGRPLVPILDNTNVPFKFLLDDGTWLDPREVPISRLSPD